jgi:cytidine deaminase
MCRQVMFEFAGRDIAVRCRNLLGHERRYRLDRLLPAPFSKRYL